MNKVFITVERVKGGDVGGLATYTAAVVDDYVEDIESDFMESRDLLDREPHEIAEVVARYDVESSDIIEAAVRHDSPIYVNGEDMSIGDYNKLIAPRA